MEAHETCTDLTVAVTFFAPLFQDSLRYLILFGGDFLTTL